MKISFWCDHCRKDLELEPDKVKRRNGEEYFYAHCLEGYKVVRYITEAKVDPYFRKSHKVQLERKMMAKDLIQPGQDGFMTFYKKEWDKLEAAREALEKKLQAKQRDRDVFLKQNSYNVHSKAAAIKVIEAEERLEHGG